jgi:hypothetical protein
MNKAQRFDCVAMKDEIQRKLLSDWKGMEDAQVVRTIRKNLSDSKSAVGAWWRRLEMKSSASDNEKPAVIH